MRMFVALSAAVLLAGCAAPEDETVETTPTPTPTAEATTEPAPTETTETETAAAETDWTDDLVAAGSGQPWADQVTSAIETEPGRMEISMTIVDPRGEDGSPEAQQAVAACEAAVDLLEDAGAAEVNVAVFEDDGTHFVLYGHPRVTEGECGEV